MESPMWMVGFIFVSCILMVIGIPCAIRGAYRANSRVRPFFLYPLICTAIMTSGFVVWELHAISVSKSSTAAIGLCLLPIVAIVVAVVGFVISWSVLYVAHFVIQRTKGTPVRLTSIVLFVLAVVMLVWTGYVGHNKIARHRLLHKAASGFDVDYLETVLADGILSRDWEVLSELAQNRNIPTNDLVRIFDYCKPSIAQFNPAEYPILFSLAQNPQTPSDILVVLAACRQSSIRYAVAINPSTQTKTLRQLAEDRDDLVRTYAKPRLRARERDEKSQKE